MIPILFETGADTFTTQGLGRLSDAISCKVAEERNGPYELEMEYPVDGIHFADVRTSRIILAKPNDTSSPQAFRIYKITKPFKKRCMVYAEHISYQLSYIPVMPFSASSFTQALSVLPSNAVENCPFTVWTDKNVTGPYELKTPMSFRAILGGIQGSLLDVYGTVEYEFDNFAVKAHLNRGSNRGVVLRYGKNITDLSQEESIANTVTGICPYWQDAESGEVVTLTEEGYGQTVLYSANAGNFPYKRSVVMDFTSSFEEAPTEAQLAAAAQRYIENNNIGVPDVSITLSFIPLWQSEEYKELISMEHVALCDTITVEFETLDVSATAKVVKTTYDVLRERYTEIEIGDARTTLAKQIANVSQQVKTQAQETTAILASTIASQTDKIVGGKGGYVKLNYNANGQPEELLIMSAQTESTSQKIIRMNQAGIGFSSDYGVTYSTAWTIDGVFNADFILAGSLSANIITAGVLQDVNGYTSFNLATGELTITKGSINLGVYDNINQRYPFSVTDAGVLTAVSARLVDATVTGTVSTIYGSYTSSLGSGFLRMFYDDTLYGRFGSAAWANNSDKRGIGMYMEAATDYMIFGRFNSTTNAYDATHLINYGLTSTETQYYEYRHIFFGSSIFVDALRCASTLHVAGQAYMLANLYMTGSIVMDSSNVVFGNSYGLRFKNTGGTEYLAAYMSSGDVVTFGNVNVPSALIGSTATLGSAGKPTVITGSTVAAKSFVKRGSETVSVSAGSTDTSTVTFDSAFAGVPTVVVGIVSSGAPRAYCWAMNPTKGGFTLKVYNAGSSDLSASIHWIAVYEP